MAAITPTDVRAIRGLVVDQLVGTTDKTYVILDITATTTATDNTYDITNALPDATGIVGALFTTIDEAGEATFDTFSGTTITFASHDGSGRYRGFFLVETN